MGAKILQGLKLYDTALKFVVQMESKSKLQDKPGIGKRWRSCPMEKAGPRRMKQVDQD